MPLALWSWNRPNPSRPRSLLLVMVAGAQGGGRFSEKKRQAFRRGSGLLNTGKPWRVQRTSALAFRHGNHHCVEGFSLPLSFFAEPFYSAFSSVLLGGLTARASPCCLFFTEVDVRQGDAPLDLFPSFASCLCPIFAPPHSESKTSHVVGTVSFPEQKKRRSTASARQREDRSGHESPSRWSRRRSAQPRLMHVHRCCLCQSESFHALPLASSVLRSLVL